MGVLKRITYLGSSLDDIRRFPENARRRAGYQLDRVQHGLDPDDWKPMASVGSGCREIRVRDKDGTFRVLCVATIDETVYVLHAFQKKTQKTSTGDLDLAKQRYGEIRDEP